MTGKKWILTGQEGYETSLQLVDSDISPSPQLGPDDVLVQVQAASLNYRELVIAKDSGGLVGPITPNVVPGSDGAGMVVSVGSNVTSLSPGDRVVTYLSPLIPHTDETILPAAGDIGDGLGQKVHGTLANQMIITQHGVIKAPSNLTPLQAATLTCSGLTAWNALFGLSGREIKKGDWVLVQGTGGVSIAALQFAVAVGANVIATTSTAEKAERLKGLGAKHVINYRETENWGEVAKKYTPDQKGVDVVVDVAGNSSLVQSLAAVKTDGIIALVGLLDKSDPGSVPMMSALWTPCIVRGIFLGSRKQYRDLVKFIEEKGIVPVLDDVVFSLDQVKEAYKRLEEQKHFSKIAIKIDE
ncbi:putative alcohol dehydrogenase [Triangularia verruculosa]|uniref:Alcohol dehydrogenase n=1 Tax=Triangularia verruculosa TaxID=2587418 RepID=A0AAN6XKI3_9PEZI|nr:putative alcohol dehydrogenase [Triangularia verruculosa]